MKTIEKKLRTFQPYAGFPFNIASVDFVDDLAEWKRKPRSVALQSAGGDVTLIHFAGEGRTLARFKTLATKLLTDEACEIIDGGEEATLVAILADTNPNPEDQEGS